MYAIVSHRRAFLILVTYTEKGSRVVLDDILVGCTVTIHEMFPEECVPENMIRTEGPMSGCWLGW